MRKGLHISTQLLWIGYFGSLNHMCLDAAIMGRRYNRMVGIAVFLLVVLASDGRAQNYLCEDQVKLDDASMACYQFGPEMPAPIPLPPARPYETRLFRYAGIEARHRLSGLASFYSTSLDGTLTANGEIYRNRRMSAAHLTLPLGCWVEIRSRATGRKINLRVNDRGPYVNKFAIDLSQAAARFLGVDFAEDRWVDIRIIALPGEEPLPQEVLDGPRFRIEEEAERVSSR